jgi:hypothetical protein
MTHADVPALVVGGLIALGLAAVIALAVWSARRPSTRHAGDHEHHHDRARRVQGEGDDIAGGDRGP